MYLKCDGTLTVDGSGVPACDNWVAVSQTELLGTIVEQYQMPAGDYAVLSSIILAMFLSAYGVRSVIQTAKPEKED